MDSMRRRIRQLDAICSFLLLAKESQSHDQSTITMSTCNDNVLLQKSREKEKDTAVNATESGLLSLLEVLVQQSRKRSG